MMSKQICPPILFVTQRLSDLTEMKRAAINLKSLGYHCIILFCGSGQKKYDFEVIKELNEAIVTSVIDGKIVSTESVSKRALKKISKKLALLERMQTKLKGLRYFQKATGTGTGTGTGTTAELEKTAVFKGCFNVHFSYIKKFIGMTVYYTLIKVVYLIRKLGLFRLFRSNNIVKIIACPMVYFTHFVLFKKILKKHQIQLIILPEDIVGYISPLLIKAGHQYQIPSMVLPYTIANQREAFQSLKNSPTFGMDFVANRIISFIFKSWVMKEAHQKVLRLPAAHVLSHVLMRTSPPDPWMMNSGYANIIAVENERMRAYYHASGIPASKMKVTGACYDDQLSYYLLDKENQRRQLYAELNIESDKPCLLIGGFPNQLIGYPPGFDFENIAEAVDFIMESLKPLRSKYEIIFRAHPNYQALGDLFAKKNCTVTLIDTARIIPLSDIYIAFASATIRWAIACGIPTINYDIFHYEFADYKEVQGVLNVVHQRDLKEAVQMMMHDEKFQQLKGHLENERSKWGLLDGQSTLRIHQLIQELLQLKPVRRTTS